jgi:hypothetical protein
LYSERDDKLRIKDRQRSSAERRANNYRAKIYTVDLYKKFGERKRNGVTAWVETKCIENSFL